MNPTYQELSGAIVKQACKDYRSALTLSSSAGKAETEALEAFFTGPWFEQLSDINGSMILKLLQSLAA